MGLLSDQMLMKKDLLFQANGCFAKPDMDEMRVLLGSRMMEERVRDRERMSALRGHSFLEMMSNSVILAIHKTHREW